MTARYGSLAGQYRRLQFKLSSLQQRLMALSRLLAMRRSDGSVGSLSNLQLLLRVRVEPSFGVLIRYNKLAITKLKKKQQQSLKDFKKRRIGSSVKRRRLRRSGFRRRGDEQGLLRRSSGYSR